MFYRITLATLLVLTASGDGPKDGRRGNQLYKQDKPEEAAAAYRTGLEASEGKGSAQVRYGLHNNLGMALNKQQNFEEAQQAFGQALAEAGSEADLARTAYNAGNNAYASNHMEDALDFYRQALLADPRNEDARYNYEYVKRRIEQQKQQQQQQGGRKDSEQDQQDQQQNQNGRNQDNSERSEDNQQNQNGDPQENQQESQESQPDQGDEQEQSGENPSPSDSDQLSRKQAERILQALENEEEQLLREVQKLKSRPRRVEKDW